MTTNNQNTLSCIEINRDAPATHSIIWLHGLGADGNDFVPLVHELRLPHADNTRFIFPHAPVMPVTVNNGYEMRAWFDIYDRVIDAKIDKNGIHESVQAIHKLIEVEVKRGVSTENITLAGFSQGAVIALITGLTFAKPLAGIIGLSGFLPLTEEVLQQVTVNQATPIFVGHGTADTIVPFFLGEMTAKQLKEAGFEVDFHSYPMAHGVCAEEVEDISAWLIKNEGNTGG